MVILNTAIEGIQDIRSGLSRVYKEGLFQSYFLPSEELKEEYNAFVARQYKTRLYNEFNELIRVEIPNFFQPANLAQFLTDLDMEANTVSFIKAAPTRIRSLYNHFYVHVSSARSSVKSFLSKNSDNIAAFLGQPASAVSAIVLGMLVLFTLGFVGYWAYASYSLFSAYSAAHTVMSAKILGSIGLSLSAALKLFAVAIPATLVGFLGLVSTASDNANIVSLPKYYAIQNFGSQDERDALCDLSIQVQHTFKPSWERILVESPDHIKAVIAGKAGFILALPKIAAQAVTHGFTSSMSEAAQLVMSGFAMTNNAFLDTLQAPSAELRAALDEASQQYATDSASAAYSSASFWNSLNDTLWDLEQRQRDEKWAYEPSRMKIAYLTAAHVVTNIVGSTCISLYSLPMLAARMTKYSFNASTASALFVGSFSKSSAVELTKWTGKSLYAAGAATANFCANPVSYVQPILATAQAQINKGIVANIESAFEYVCLGLLTAGIIGLTLATGISAIWGLAQAISLISTTVKMTSAITQFAMLATSLITLIATTGYMAYCAISIDISAYNHQFGNSFNHIAPSFPTAGLAPSQRGSESLSLEKQNPAAFGCSEDFADNVAKAENIYREANTSQSAQGIDLSDLNSINPVTVLTGVENGSVAGRIGDQIVDFFAQSYSGVQARMKV